MFRIVINCSTKHMMLLYVLLRMVLPHTRIASEVSFSEWLAGRHEPLALSPADRFSVLPVFPGFRLSSFLSLPRNSLPSRHPPASTPSGVQAVPSGRCDSTPDTCQLNFGDSLRRRSPSTSASLTFLLESRHQPC